MTDDVSDALEGALASLRAGRSPTISTAAFKDDERLFDRISHVNVAFANLIGVNSATFDWCPNHRPPTDDECLAWLWVQRPDWSDAIAARTAYPFLSELIWDYQRRAGPQAGRR